MKFINGKYPLTLSQVYNPVKFWCSFSKRKIVKKFPIVLGIF